LGASAIEKDEQVDSSTYEKARGYLKAALEQMIAAGRNVKEFGDFYPGKTLAIPLFLISTSLRGY